MRILVVCQHYWPEPFNVTETCEGLARMGHLVTVLTGLPNYSEGVIPDEYLHGNKRRETRNDVEIIRVPIVARGKDLNGINKLRRIANYFSFAFAGSLKTKRLRSDFDCVLVVQYSPILMAKPGITYSKKHSVPLVIYSYDLWPEDLLTGGLSRDGVPYKLMLKVSRRIYGAADGVLVTSPGFVEYFESELQLSGLACEFLPQYAEEQFEAMEVSESTDNEIVRFLFAGNIGGNQSVETIVEAAKYVQDDIRIKIDIVGSGSHLDACMSLAQSYDLNNIVFHGRKPIEEMKKYYTAADCMLLTLAKPDNGSKVAEYTIPRKLQSYLAAGKPIISCAPGISGQIVREANCGISCKPGQAQDLSMAMKSFADRTAEERKMLAENSKSYYMNNYSKEHYFKIFDSYLEEMKGHKHGV